MSGATLNGRYFDGRTAAAHAVTVALSAEGMAIRGDQLDIFWPARRIILVSRDAAEIRLADRKDDHARLALGAAAADALTAILPELLSGRHERSRMATLIIAMILATGLIAATIFIGAPRAA